MKTKTITTPELKKGNVVLFYGARFEILEDTRNVSWNEEKRPQDREPLELQAFGAKAMFIEYEDGSGKKGDSLLENYDWFQGNSRAKSVIEDN